MPNGPDGLNPGVKWGITGDPELGDTAANLPARTEAAVKAALKTQNIADGNSVWTRPEGPFGALSTLLGITGKGPFEALVHRIGQALLDLPGHVWSDIESALSDLGSIPTTLTDHTEAIANLSHIAAAMNTTSAYVGDLQDMVTVPRSQLVTFGQTGAPVDILTAQLIVLATVYTCRAMPVIYPVRYVGHTKGDIYYTPIVVDRFGQVDKFRWIAGADSSLFSIDYYEVALCAYNPSSGNIEKVWGSGDIKDDHAAVDHMTEVEIDMGLTQSVTPGQILFAAHQQVAAGLLQGSRAFAAVPQSGVERPAGTLLRASCYRAENYTQGIPSSISLSSLTRDNRFTPWSAVTVTTG